MPRILVFGRYVLFFWIAENGEPVHIHVGVKRAAANSTKFWLTKNGGCTLANNESKIPAKDLRDLSKLITMNHRYICDKWRETFGDDSLTFGDPQHPVQQCVRLRVLPRALLRALGRPRRSRGLGSLQPHSQELPVVFV